MKRTRILRAAVLGLFFPALTVTAQVVPLTLEECYSLAQEHYPLTKQRELISRSMEYSVQNVSKGYLPQLNINGQAGYQSDVTQIPVQLPGMDIPVISKDQYRLYGEVMQTLYDGGQIRRRKQAEAANAMVDMQQLEVELYQLKERINQLFFGILLLDEQIRQQDLLLNDLRTGISTARASVAYGTALKSSVDMLEAELLNAGQRTTGLQAMRQAYAEMLSLFTGRPADSLLPPEKPATAALPEEINRPELLWYAYRSRRLEVEDKLLVTKNMPRLSLFLQGGYGRPALNMLSNDFEAYYLGGVRLNVPLTGLYTLKKERALIGLQQGSIAAQRETFLFRTRLTLRQQNAEIGKLQALLATDDAIIALRTEVKKAATAQLENGVIHAGDYLREVIAEANARQNRTLHEIQLLMAQYDQQTTTGNPPKTIQE